MLKQRVITALIGLPALLAVILWTPEPWFGLLFMALAVVAWLEYQRLVGPLSRPLIVGALTTGLAFIAAMTASGYALGLGIITAGYGLLAAVAVFSYGHKPTILNELARVWLGLCLVVFPLGLMAALAATGIQGRYRLIFLLITVFASDTGAYFVGRAVGGPKMYPKLSPAKTWAGLGGALVAGALIGLAASSMSDFSVRTMVPAGIVLAGLGQAGDLMVSVVKRTHQVKDAGGLLPGHGGILDRLDSFIITAPALSLALMFLPGVG